MDILYEDKDLFVINKPPGIVVNRAQSVKGETVHDWAEKIIQNSKVQIQNEGSEEYYSRAGIVHRLDKETSGCLLIAKTPKAFRNLQKQFKDRVVGKTYRAIVHGNVSPRDGTIHVPVGRLPWNRKRFGVVPGGKDAYSTYKTISHHTLGKSREARPVTLLEVYPRTGRTHQIRVHMKYIRHPVVGDMFYAGRKTSRLDRQLVPRAMLHAYIIRFNSPSTDNMLAIQAPMPDDMNTVVTQ